MIRIVFVDDEPNVLKGLMDALRRQRRSWEMTFFESGSQALNFLSQNSADIIVSDMRMPQMDGGELLEAVRQLHPHMTRIVLSGHSERDQLLRASAVAHQYLSKPCNGQALRDALAGIARAREQFSNRGVHEMVGRLDALTSVGALQQEMMQFTAGGSSIHEALAILLAKESDLEARVVELACQAFPELDLGVQSNTKVLDALGFERVHGISLAASMVADLIQCNAFEKFGHARWIKHSLRCARIAEELIFEPDQKAAGFSAGLLHNIGEVVHSLIEPEVYVEIGNAIASDASDPCEVETNALGFHHGQTGGFLLDSWGLKPEIAQVALHHHETEPTLSSALKGQERLLSMTKAIQLADRLADCDSSANEPLAESTSRVIQTLRDDWSRRDTALVEA
ncbi:MAG: HDOD domain-containing protein [Burkholderiaceae bacterium]